MFHDVAGSLPPPTVARRTGFPVRWQISFGGIPDTALRPVPEHDHVSTIFWTTGTPAARVLPKQDQTTFIPWVPRRIRKSESAVSFRKEVIQPQVPLRLPCYDLVPIAEFILDAWLLAVTSAASDAPHFRGLTGGVYKAQEHIHRGMLTRDY